MSDSDSLAVLYFRGPRIVAGEYVRNADGLAGLGRRLAGREIPAWTMPLSRTRTTSSGDGMQTSPATQDIVIASAILSRWANRRQLATWHTDWSASCVATECRSHPGAA